MVSLLLLPLFFFTKLSEARVYDLYRSDGPKGAFCTAIGGACAADPSLENAFFGNPATLAIGKKDWNFDGDFSKKSHLEPGMSEDNDVHEVQAYGGMGISQAHFGAGISFYWQRDDIDSNVSIYDSNNLPLRTKLSAQAFTRQLNFPVALQVTDDLSLGLTTTFTMHHQEISVAGAVPTDQNDPNGSALSLTVGSFWHYSPNLHLGTYFHLPSTIYETVKFNATLGPTNILYLEDFALHMPWKWSIGASYEIINEWHFFLEGDLIGKTGDAYLLSYNTMSSSFGDRNLVVKGRSIVFESHWGVRKQFSRFFIGHFGGYFEPTRWEGYQGRLHTTGGLSYKANDWLELIGGIDVAKNYVQFLFTIR